MAATSKIKGTQVQIKKEVGKCIQKHNLNMYMCDQEHMWLTCNTQKWSYMYMYYNYIRNNQCSPITHLVQLVGYMYITCTHSIVFSVLVHVCGSTILQLWAKHVYVCNQNTRLSPWTLYKKLVHVCKGNQLYCLCKWVSHAFSYTFLWSKVSLDSELTCLYY